MGIDSWIVFIEFSSVILFVLVFGIWRIKKYEDKQEMEENKENKDELDN